MYCVVFGLEIIKSTVDILSINSYIMQCYMDQSFVKDIVLIQCRSFKSTSLVTQYWSCAIWNYFSTGFA